MITLQPLTTPHLPAPSLTAATLPQADLAWAEQFFISLGRELGQVERDFFVCWQTAQTEGAGQGFSPEMEAMFSRLADLNTLGGDVLHQLRPSLPLDEATVARWMSAASHVADTVSLPEGILAGQQGASAAETDWVG